MYRTVANPAKFFEHKPTLILSIGRYSLWEHPLRGDSAPLYMSTPDGRLINTGFYDIGDFDLSLCEEIANSPCEE